MTTVWGLTALDNSKETRGKARLLAHNNHLAKNIPSDMPCWEDWMQCSFYEGQVQSWIASNQEAAAKMIAEIHSEIQKQEDAIQQKKNNNINNYNKNRKKGDWLCECGHHNISRQTYTDLCGKCGCRKGYVLVNECMGKNDKPVTNLIRIEEFCSKCRNVDPDCEKMKGHRGRCITKPKRKITKPKRKITKPKRKITKHTPVPAADDDGDVVPTCYQVGGFKTLAEYTKNQERTTFEETQKLYAAIASCVSEMGTINEGCAPEVHRILTQRSIPLPTHK